MKILLIVLGTISVGFILGFLARLLIAKIQLSSAENKARNMMEEITRDAETKKKEILIEAKDYAIKERSKLERETRERRSEIQAAERRLVSKEEHFEKKVNIIEKKEDELRRLEKDIKSREISVEEASKRYQKELEKLSGLSAEEAKKLLLSNIEKEVRHDAAKMIANIENRAKKEADDKAKEILAVTIQRMAAETTSDAAVTSISIPNDEMKGRIIGREGRNIRALETLTGVNIIIDDTPEAVVISSFDPIRREVARMALEKLMLDGRIHPARIEEVVNNVKKDLEKLIIEEGEKNIYEFGIQGLHDELIKMIGKLKYRTSYGQNVLDHSKEVAYLASAIASELGLDSKMAKRAGLLHDIGKVVSVETEGAHSTLGAEMAKKYNESDIIVNSIEAHHDDVEKTSVYSTIIQAADAISAARPGARRESLDNYLKRLENLEKIAMSFEGVEKTYAIQAGREVRIMVANSKISDEDSKILARDIAKKIEDELVYPGQVKVIVIRETRAVEYAR